MHIIVIGGGGVGYELARSLSEKNQDVAVIEKDPEKAYQINERLDAMVIEGNGANVAVLEKAGVKEADIVAAVTEIDEVNIIACMVAKRLGVNITVARVRGEEYFEKSHALLQEQMGLDFIINPEKVAAQEISEMIHFPDASDVEYFAQGKVMMLGIIVGQDAGITNRTLKELPLPPGCIIVGINRPGGEFLVPGGRDMIKPGDKIYLQGKPHVLREVSWMLHHERLQVQRVTILGGGRTGFQLASLLENNGLNRKFSVKLVEKDPNRCEELSRYLSHTLILQGDATDLSFFRGEEIEEADVLVAATGDDRTNILASLLGKQLGVKKIISEITDLEYIPIFQTLGIDSTINSRLIAASQILRFTRKEDIISLSVLQDENAEMLELILPDTARAAGKKINKLNLPRGMLIGALVRNGEVVIPHGDTMLLAHDRLVIFTLPHISAQLDRFFAGTHARTEGGKMDHRF
ncbi:MAG: Trk system potassium transporter TrkA [Dethiobacteria bacterium]